MRSSAHTRTHTHADINERNKQTENNGIYFIINYVGATKEQYCRPHRILSSSCPSVRHDGIEQKVYIQYSILLLCACDNGHCFHRANNHSSLGISYECEWKRAFDRHEERFFPDRIELAPLDPSNLEGYRKYHFFACVTHDNITYIFRLTFHMCQIHSMCVRLEPKTLAVSQTQPGTKNYLINFGTS